MVPTKSTGFALKSASYVDFWRVIVVPSKQVWSRYPSPRGLDTWREVGLPMVRHRGPALLLASIFEPAEHSVVDMAIYLIRGCDILNFELEMYYWDECPQCKIPCAWSIGKNGVGLSTLAYFGYPDMYSQPTLFTMRILSYFSISSTLMTKASPIDESILTQFLESTIRISREPALDKCLMPLGRYPPPPWFGDLGTMNLSTKLLIASLPAMPATEANTMAIVSSMQLKMSGFTTEPVTLLGSDLRTKNMRMKLMIETLDGLVSLIDLRITFS